MKALSAAAARALTSATIRICGLTVSVMLSISALRRGPLKKRRGRGLPRPRGKRRSEKGLADALRDRGRRTTLEVGDGGRVRVLDAVARVVRTLDGDVLDAGVVRELELGQRRARVARGMVDRKSCVSGKGVAGGGL